MDGDKSCQQIELIAQVCNYFFKLESWVVIFLQLIKIKISAYTTKTFPPGKHFYDIELEDDDGVVYKLLKGRVEVLGEITQDDN